MPRATWMQTNFNGGEWSPLTSGRVNLEKYKNALSLCRNYVPTPQGGITRRPGFKWAAEVKDSSKRARLQRFEFSTTQAYVLEFGPSYIRFYANDGQLQTSGVAAYNNATAYAIGDLVTNGGVTYYCIAATTGNAPPNATYWYAHTGTIYEIPTPYAEADLFNLNFAQSADVLYIVHPSYPPRKLQRLGATKWTLSTISFRDGPYLIANTSSTTLTSSVAGPGAATVTASAVTGINNDTGFQASDVGRIIRLKSGSTWGWGTITAVGSTTSITVNWTVAVGTSAATTWRLGVWGATNGYPVSVCFHEDRLVFAGCTQYPQRLDGSNTSDYENFSPSATDGTIADSNAYSFSLNSNTVNAVRWIQSDERGMVIGTAGGEWIVRGSSVTNSALTPTNVSAKQPSTFGSAAVQAVKVGKGTLFVQRNARRLRELAYVYTVDGFMAPDISQLAEHLPGRGIKQMAVQWTPYQVIWACCNDGSLISLTYDREQEIVGWAQHTIGGNGTVESVACIPSSDSRRDELWALTNRTIGGTTKRYVEYSAKYWENGDAVKDCVFLDSAATYSGTPVSTISGLSYLEGQTVSVLADGAAHPDCVVSSGNISLQRSASTVQVGLSYNSEGQTQRIEAGGADGTAQGKLKRIHRVIFRFFQSIGLTVQANWNGAPAIEEPFRDSSMPMDNGVTPYTGDKRWAWEGTWETEGFVAWKQSQPLPSNILALVVQLETQDGG